MSYIVQWLTMIHNTHARECTREAVEFAALTVIFSAAFMLLMCSLIAHFFCEFLNERIRVFCTGRIQGFWPWPDLWPALLSGYQRFERWPGFSQSVSFAWSVLPRWIFSFRGDEGWNCSKRGRLTLTDFDFATALRLLDKPQAGRQGVLP